MKTHHFIAVALSCAIALAGCGAPDNSTTNTVENTVQTTNETTAAPIANAAEPPTQSGKTYSNLRGQIVKIVPYAQKDEPVAVEIDHEAVLDFMQAMRMTIPLQNADDAKMLKAGDKIRFDLLLGKGLEIANIEMLPATTKLNLAENAKTEKMEAKP